MLRWINSRLSGDRLGSDRSVRFVERNLTNCHPDNAPSVQADLEAARRHEGLTLFDMIVAIISDHVAQAGRKRSLASKRCVAATIQKLQHAPQRWR